MIELPTFEYITKFGEVKLFDWKIFEVDVEKQAVNATAMAKPFGKVVNDFLRLETTQKFIVAFMKKYPEQGNPCSIIKQSDTHGKIVVATTWFHRKLAIKFAQWISVDFELWCIDALDHLFQTGSVSLTDHTRLLEENDGLKKKLDMLIHDENCYLARHIASELGVTAQTLNKVLHMAKVQFQADHVWIPYAKYSNDGIIKTRQMLIGPKVIYHSKWTSKGREFIKTNWQNWCKVYLIQKFLQDKQPNLFNQGE